MWELRQGLIRLWDLLYSGTWEPYGTLNHSWDNTGAWELNRGLRPKTTLGPGTTLRPGELYTGIWDHYTKTALEPALGLESTVDLGQWDQAQLWALGTTLSPHAEGQQPADHFDGRKTEVIAMCAIQIIKKTRKKNKPKQNNTVYDCNSVSR